jgi:hypothetical protein
MRNAKNEIGKAEFFCSKINICPNTNRSKVKSGTKFGFQLFVEAFSTSGETRYKTVTVNGKYLAIDWLTLKLAIILDNQKYNITGDKLSKMIMSMVIA